MIAALAPFAIADVVILGLPGLDGGIRLAGHLILTPVGLAIAARRGSIGIGAGILGLFGPVGLIVAQLLSQRHRVLRLPAGTDPARGGSSVEGGSTGARMLDGRLHHASAGTLGSLVTVLRHGSVSARRRAVETVVRSFEPALSPVIARALADRDQTIRALAAAAAARVSRNLAQGRVALARRAENGDAAAGDTLVAMLADHARANVLLSDAQRDHLRRDVLALLRDRPDGAVQDPALATTLAEAAWSVGDFALIDDLARQGDGDALTWWRAECRA